MAFRDIQASASDVYELLPSAKTGATLDYDASEDTLVVSSSKTHPHAPRAVGRREEGV